MLSYGVSSLGLEDWKLSRRRVSSPSLSDNRDWATATASPCCSSDRFTTEFAKLRRDKFLREDLLLSLGVDGLSRALSSLSIAAPSSYMRK